MLYRVLLTLFFTVTTTIYGAGVNIDNLLACSKIDNNNTRLKCYDDYLVKKNLNENDKNTTKVTVIKNKGKWEIFEDIDPLTDKKIVILSLNANNSVVGNFSFESNTPTLMIRCKNNKTETYINWGLYLGIDRAIITTRIDKNKKRTRAWGVSTDYKAAFHPIGYKFAKQLLNHKKLVAQVTPYSASPVTATFDILGFKYASEKLRKQCKWK